MKHSKFLLISAGCALMLTGCETPYGTPDRAGTGALIGAGAGAATGALVAGGHNAPIGALIGGGLGALTGGLIGHSMDAEERARLEAQAPLTYTRIDQGQPLGLEDIKAMVRAGVSDDVIISQIRNTHTAYRLNATDIIALHDSGVSQRVIDFMINTQSMASAPAPAEPTEVTQVPPPPATEPVVVAPGPGYAWVPGEWSWRGRWVWVGGYWAVPPYPHAVWVHGGWYRGAHGWYRSRGHWG